MSEYHFHSRLKSHRGGLVRFVGDFYLPVQDCQLQSLSSKIGILIDAKEAVVAPAVVSLLIDGSVKEIYVAPGLLELIGGAGDE
jgi:hypothetical protein